MMSHNLPDSSSIKFAEGSDLASAAKTNPYLSPGTFDNIIRDAPSSTIAAHAIIKGTVNTSYMDSLNLGQSSDHDVKKY
jgi:hypothetical protein